MCIRTTPLYPPLCWWTFRLLPCLEECHIFNPHYKYAPSQRRFIENAMWYEPILSVLSLHLPSRDGTQNQEGESWREGSKKFLEEEQTQNSFPDIEKRPSFFLFGFESFIHRLPFVFKSHPLPSGWITNQNKSYTWSTYRMSHAVLSTLQALSSLALKTAWWGTWYYEPHFTSEEIYKVGDFPKDTAISGTLIYKSFRLQSQVHNHHSELHSLQHILEL